MCSTAVSQMKPLRFEVTARHMARNAFPYRELWKRALPRSSAVPARSIHVLSSFQSLNPKFGIN